MLSWMLKLSMKPPDKEKTRPLSRRSSENSECWLNALQNTENWSFKDFKMMAGKSPSPVEPLLMSKLLTELMLLLLWEADALLLERSLILCSLEMISKLLSKLSCGVETSTTMLLDSFNSRLPSIFLACWLFSLPQCSLENHHSQLCNFSGSILSWTLLLPLLLVLNHLFQLWLKENHSQT